MWYVALQNIFLLVEKVGVHLNNEKWTVVNVHTWLTREMHVYDLRPCKLNV